MGGAGAAQGRGARWPSDAALVRGCHGRERGGGAGAGARTRRPRGKEPKGDLDSAYKSKLKHIDVRQEWVKALHNKNILYPVHVDTNNNLADLFTKILSKVDFQRLRDSMMKRQSAA